MIKPPTNTPSYMWPAWCGSLYWAIGEPDIRAAFEKDSGLHYSEPTSPIESMIDDATGYPQKYIEAFAEWHDKHVWGDPFAPPEEDEVRA